MKEKFKIKFKIVFYIYIYIIYHDKNIFIAEIFNQWIGIAISFTK